jgi:hypothetical protein
MRIMVKMISIMYVIDHDYHDAHEMFLVMPIAVILLMTVVNVHISD